jgi:hypothetical protein
VAGGQRIVVTESGASRDKSNTFTTWAEAARDVCGTTFDSSPTRRRGHRNRTRLPSPTSSAS